MLNVQIAPHREFLPADSSEQKLFVMLKLRPKKEVANTRPPTTFVFLIDTSGSMREVVVGDVVPTGNTFMVDGQEYMGVTGGETKIDIVIESLKKLIHSGKLSASDRIAIVKFDDSAATLIQLTPATQTSQLESAIEQLREFSGGTRMGAGLRGALSLLSGQNMTIRRTLLFTDGQTFDEDVCRAIASEFASNNTPITALGVGEFNENLLTYLSDTTGGIPLHIVAEENPGGAAVSISKLPDTIIQEFTQAQQEVITNLALTVKTVKGVKLTRIVRAYPSQAEFSLTQDPYPIGNAVGNDETVFILEFSMESRAASRVRIAQLGLTYDVPGQNRRGELPPANLLVQFVAGQVAAQVDQEVMGYVQQCNISQLVGDATRIAESNPQKAQELLETARRMTVRIGNDAMTQSLNQAQDELRKTRRLSDGTRKTVKMGSKGKTVKMGGDINDELSEEQIRNLSGT
ncbi:VWA domain-containing protein [Microcoleus sp. LEGE 07076]|uniref:vWA domain-containing protein n=1 Tax=Microcoleus sp. LEGE 07076 TaxID=915322 RepID=UPI00188245F6|nr:VWA domain-containing protein [Microcoleus sp. LEGE 07076]MBE9188564.1 VWA domain-containing protein [Microcoleus sp. LEGE 07076]